MPYIGNPIYQSAFITDQFSGNGSTTAFTMSVAPAGVSNVLVAVSGVLQDPSTYGVVGTTLNFTTAPPSGTGNISVRYLGVPVTGVTTTAYRTVTEFTATAGQTTFTPPSYTVGYISVYLNGVLLGSADYTASNGTTVVLTTGASAGNILTTESFYVSSVLNAIPNTAGSVSSSNIQTSVTLTTPTIDKINTSVTNTSLGAGNSSIMKNRIINGAFTISQYNGSSSVNPTDNTCFIDRWKASIYPTASKFTVQQNAGSVTPPAGFPNYLGITSSSAYTSGAGDQYFLTQRIEGYNFADLAWGTASAKTITVSFWVYSSLATTFAGSILNSNGNRSYPFTYTTTATNTWTYVTQTIPGCTDGTWNTTNNIGALLCFNLGTGSTYSGTAGAWTNSEKYSVTGTTNLLATNGATLYITGVQLEVGSSATGYEYENYTSLLSKCQRYYYKLTQGSGSSRVLSGYNQTSTQPIFIFQFPVTMRTYPTSLETNGTASHYAVSNLNVDTTCTAVPFYNDSSTQCMSVVGPVTGVTAGQGCQLRYLNSTSYLAVSAEL